METTWLLFGVLRRPHGTQGEILLAPYNPDGDGSWLGALPIPARWVKDDRGLDLAIVASRRVLAGFLVRFEGMSTRAAVAGLVGGEVRFPRGRLAGPAEPGAARHEGAPVRTQESGGGGNRCRVEP